MAETPRIIDPAAEGASLDRAIRVLADGAGHLDRVRAGEDATFGDLGPAEIVPVLLASLAAGRPARVRAVIRLLATRPSGDAGGPALLPLLLGRYHAWTGDTRTAVAAWPAAREAADRLTGGVPNEADAVLETAAALASVERLAGDLGDPAAAANVHRAARAAVAAAAEAVDHVDPALVAALDLPGLGRRRDPDAAARPASSTPRPEPAGADPIALLPAAMSVLHTLHVRLGIAPDAPRHRLWIRPELRPGDGLAAEGIVVGEDSFSLEAESAVGLARLRVAQAAGPIPATVLLELWAGSPVAGTWVDDAPAALTPTQSGCGWVVPVQLVLDHPRTLEIRS